MGRLRNAVRKSKIEITCKNQTWHRKKCASILNARCKYKGREMLLFARNICVSLSSHLLFKQRTKAIFEQVVLLQQQK